MKRLLMGLMILVGLSVFGSTTTVKAAQTDANNKFGITIDGNFSDWENKPKTDIDFGQADNFNIKQGVLLADQNNIYFYLDMSPKHGVGYAELQTSSYELKVGNKRYWLDVQGAGGLTVNQVKRINLKIWENDDTGGNVLGVFDQVKAYERRTPVHADSGVINGTSDKMEVMIPLSVLKVGGTTEQKISIHNANLGNQTLNTVGGSTGPILLAISGLAIAVLAIMKLPKVGELRKSLHE